MKPHKHAELIKLWADGAVIEKFWNGAWHEFSCTPDWDDDYKYRIKPEPKPPDEAHFYQALFDDLDAHRVNVDHANLKLTFRGEGKNMKLIDAEVLK